MTSAKTRFLEDFTAQEVIELEALHAAKVAKSPEVGWFNRHFVEEQGIYYCNHCGWPSKITNRTRTFQRSLQKMFLGEARKHVDVKHGDKLNPTKTHDESSGAEADVPTDYRDEYEYEFAGR